MKKLAIRGHSTRGKEVIEILEMLGGKNSDIVNRKFNMTPEQKELLLKDLCARLEYDVKLSYRCNHIHILKGIHKSGLIVINDIVTNVSTTTDVENITPYLFPMSSMTEEQWNNAPTINLTNFTFESFKCECFTLASYTCDNNLHDLLEFIDWLIANHFDIHNLIPMELANDATGKNIY